jgi:hypothetical protein
MCCRRIFTLILSISIAALSIYSQTSTGEINGTVTDSAGAAVPGAAVRLVSEETKIETATATNADGYFRFVNVKPGNYTVAIEMQGFKRTITAPFTLAVSETSTQNITLQVGNVAETVEISGGSEVLQTTTTELGTVISERSVQELPLNGRNFTQLLTLTPGVTPVSTSQNRSIGGVEGNVGLPGSGFSDASFHGQQNRSKLYFFDGIINTNIRGPNYIVIPNIDLIQEFKVVGHDAKAEFGGAAGGVVNMVSKSGGNKLHGSAFEFVRNDAFDARNSFDVCTTARCRPGQGVPEKPLPFRQNQFGFVVNGPIFKNRTFFSGGYDGWRYSQPGLGLSYVPTAAEINGDFTNTPFRRQIFNPYSTRQTAPNTFARDPFRCDASGNPLPVNAQKLQDQTIGTPCFKIPQALMFGPMQQFFRTYSAAPNLTGDPQNNFAQGRATTNQSDGYQIRVDHKFTDSDSAFFRFTLQRVTVFNPIGEVGSTSGSSNGFNYGGAWTHTFTSNLILDVRGGYAGRPGVDASQQNQHEAGLDPLNSAGFRDIDKYQGLLVRLSNWVAGGSNDFGVRGAALRENPNWSVTPNLIWLKGNHAMKFGAWYIQAKRIQLNTFQRYTFADTQTSNPAQASTGLSLASALLGFPSSADAQLPEPGGGPVQFKYASWAGYIQDEWRLSPNLMLTLGLRYDYLNQPKTLDGRLWNALDLENQFWIIGASQMPPRCSVAGRAPCIPDAFFSDAHFNNVVLSGQDNWGPRPIHDNLGPRIGVAWTLNQKTVLRAGYGLYFDPLPARSQYAQNDLEATVWPDATAFAVSNANVPANFVGGTAANIIQIQSQGFAAPLPTTTPWGVGGFPNTPRYEDPYSHQWHVEVQRQLTPTTLVSVAYVGSRTYRLPYSGFANAARQASPNGTPSAVIDALRLMPWVSAGLNYTTNQGKANYNALQARFQRRFSKGWSTLLSYTWSKSIDTSSGYFNVENGPGGSSTIQNYYDTSTARGVSSYDIPHFLSWATVYEFPFGRGRKWFNEGPASWILGDWQLNYIFQARSGSPFNLIVTGDLANLRGNPNVGAPNNYLRPNLIANPFVAGPVAANPDPACQRTISQGGKAADEVHTVASWFNPCAFGIPIGAFGNLGRNVFRGKAVYTMDMSLFKNFRIREDWKLQLRAEAFNIFNTQNWDTPANANLTLNTNNTTLATGVGRISNLAQGTTPRQIQFGIRFVF